MIVRIDELDGVVEPLWAIAFGPPLYRRVRPSSDTFAAVGGEPCRLRLLDPDRLKVTLEDDCGEPVSYTLELSASELSGSMWSGLCGLTYELSNAIAVGLTEIDLSLPQAMLQKVIQVTYVRVSGKNDFPNQEQRYALNYLRAATQLTKMWMINLAGPIRIFSLDDIPGRSFLEPIWTGWELPAPLNSISPTLSIGRRPTGSRRLKISPMFILCHEEVQPFSAVEHMKANLKLESFFGSAAVADGLFQFAHDLREPLFQTGR